MAEEEKRRRGIALYIFIALLIVTVAFDAWETSRLRRVTEEANRHSEESNRILSGRDFGRIYAEHAELKGMLCEAHPELKEKCGGVR